MLAAVITKLKRKLLLRQFLLMSVGSIIYAAAIAFSLTPTGLWRR